ncbi:MAG TPA: hypothetical protein VFV96_17480 [Verrucomicrobiae bacterium]|nr:hypothetical protein [Verrucomicrobiae bacterium]
MFAIRSIQPVILAALLGGAIHAKADAQGLALQPPTPHARVVTVQDPRASTAFKPDARVVQDMLNRGLTNLTGQASVAAAWAGLIGSNEVVGIKVYSAPGRETGTHPEVVAAVINGLLSAGIPARHIIVWDHQEADLRRAGFFALTNQFGVRVAGAAEAGYDEKTFYETALIGNLVYGDLEFGKHGEGVGRKSFVSKLVSQQITRIINVAPVLNQNGAGVAGNLFSLALGSVDNSLRFDSVARLSVAVPEIYALPALSDKVALNITDALICQYEGGERGLLHYSVVLNEIRLSRDPVALDVLALQDLERSRHANAPGEPPVATELYKNAALLELGTADPARIDVTTLRPPPHSETTTR